MSPVRVIAVKQTCDACPSQWEGHTDDGRAIYVRYRWGHLAVGIGATVSDAVGDSSLVGMDFGDSMNGVMDGEQLVRLTSHAIQWDAKP